MNTKRETEPVLGSSSGDTPLDERYGSIGISAVAAALPYCQDIKNPAYAPTAPRPDKLTTEFAS
jgi:hypothetical protein